MKDIEAVAHDGKLIDCTCNGQIQNLRAIVCGVQSNSLMNLPNLNATTSVQTG